MLETKRIIHSPDTIHTRKKPPEISESMTPQERRLWYDFLQNYPVKIYRQQPIDRFIIDFYCSKAYLVIEVDGSQHYTTDGMIYDGLRTETLERYQLAVIRFSNLEIQEDFAGVCAAIDKKIKERLQQWAD